MVFGRFDCLEIWICVRVDDGWMMLCVELIEWMLFNIRKIII